MRVFPQAPVEKPASLRRGLRLDPAASERFLFHNVEKPASLRRGLRREGAHGALVAITALKNPPRSEED